MTEFLTKKADLAAAQAVADRPNVSLLADNTVVYQEKA